MICVRGGCICEYASRVSTSVFDPCFWSGKMMCTRFSQENDFLLQRNYKIMARIPLENRASKLNVVQKVSFNSRHVKV